MDEGRCPFHEQVPLPHRGPDQADPVVLEVPQAAVDEAGRLAARAAREIAALHEGRSKPAARRVPGDPGSDDAAPDHEEGEGFVAHAREARRSGLGGERASQEGPATRVPGFMILSGSSSRFTAPRTTKPASPMTRCR